MNIECLEIANKAVFCQSIPQKKGGVLYQLYKIDIFKPCLCDGTNEKGFCLNFHILNKPSNLVLTEYQILKLLHGDTILLNNMEWKKV